METKQGMSLELILGPMFAGKSTELIRRVRRLRSVNKKVFVINHSFNARYSTDNVTTHDATVLHSNLNTKNLMEAEELEDFLTADIIVIEELQFFEDAALIVPAWVDHLGKHVIASGLSGTAERIPMGDVHLLVPHADDISFLTALCPYCADGTRAPFSKRIYHQTTSEVDVGGADKYVATCRRHFF
jgi:thymidine kinase